MRCRIGSLFVVCGLLCVVMNAGILRAASAVGDFEDHGDVGKPAKAGSADFDAKSGTYTICGGGANMWAKADAFHFVWKRMSGDVTLAADIGFPNAGGNAHRKACLIIRQGLEADSAYADVAVHGVGLTSLQYRESAGEITKGIEAKVAKPLRVQIEKKGDVISLSFIAKGGEAMQKLPQTITLKLQEPFYVGLAVCAHDDAAIEKAEFGNVKLSGGR
jgi:hypothetical protein